MYRPTGTFSLFCLVCIMLLLLCFAVPGFAQSQARVDTPSGPLLGVSQNGVTSFKGIPFAAPPVGDLRFAPPQDRAPWVEPLNASEYGPVCLQYTNAFPGKPMSEDCLYLNVWAPANAKSDAKLPVFVYVPGGGFMDGAGSAPNIESSNFARDDIITVTFNYRLNVLGYFASETTLKQYGTTGNWGVLDQVKALEWVQKHIAAFGGDPGNVTVGGNSSGGYTVAGLLVSPLTKGLFHRAIVMSGTVVGMPAITYHTWSDLQRTIDLCKVLGAVYGAEDNAEGLAQLRAIDPDVLNTIGRSRDPNASLGTAAFFLIPVFDGGALPRDPLKALRDGNFHKVPLLTGYNTDEGTGFIPSFCTKAQYEMLTTRMIGREAARKYMAQYPVTEQFSALTRTRDMFSDVLYRASAKVFADIYADNGQPVYAYNFAYVSKEAAEKKLGAAHGAQTNYIFKNLGGLPSVAPEQTVLADEMHSRVANFIKTGNPNSGLPANAVAWPRYKSSDRLMLRFDAPVSQEPMDVKNLQFMEDLIYGKKPFYIK